MHQRVNRIKRVKANETRVHKFHILAQSLHTVICTVTDVTLTIQFGMPHSVVMRRRTFKAPERLSRLRSMTSSATTLGLRGLGYFLHAA